MKINVHFKTSKAVGFPQHHLVDLQVENILKHLETPYSDDMEDEEASFSRTTTAEPSPSLTDHRERTFYNVYEKHGNFLEKLPEDVLNMRLS